jgi:hypothetical protein
MPKRQQLLLFISISILERRRLILLLLFPLPLCGLFQPVQPLGTFVFPFVFAFSTFATFST